LHILIYFFSISAFPFWAPLSLDFLLITSETSVSLLSPVYEKFALLLDAHQLLVLF
jgi:hypothetical protein